MSTRQLSPAQRAAEALGQRLREIRTGANLTGRALAAEAGWHYTKVSRMEHGGKTPTEDQIPDLNGSDLRTVRSEHPEKAAGLVLAAQHDAG